MDSSVTAALFAASRRLEQRHDRLEVVIPRTSGAGEPGGADLSRRMRSWPGRAQEPGSRHGRRWDVHGHRRAGEPVTVGDEVVGIAKVSYAEYTAACGDKLVRTLPTLRDVCQESRSPAEHRLRYLRTLRCCGFVSDAGGLLEPARGHVGREGGSMRFARECAFRAARRQGRA
jgi:hypothetical protein